MNKRIKSKKIAFLLTLVLVLSMTVQSTMAFIVTGTSTLFNTFIPLERLANDLIISKVVEHPFGEEYTIPDNVAFDFKVTLGKDYAQKTIVTTAGDFVADKDGNITVTVKPGGFVGLKDLNEGTEVSVTEVLKEGSGFSVKDNVITKTETAIAGADKTLEFINVYTPAAVEPANVEILGTKNFEGRPWQEGDNFTFKLELFSEENSWTEVGTKTVTYDAKNAEFNKFEFSSLIHKLRFGKAGEYKFRLTEDQGSFTGVKYDETVYEFAILVGDADMDGKLEVQDVKGTNTSVVEDTAKDKYTIEIEFNNVFDASTITGVLDIYVPITINKTVVNKGTGTMTPEGFQFVLEDVDTGEKLSVKSDEEGKAQLPISFAATEVGKTYNFKLYEVNDGKENVTYSEKVYSISITIGIDASNKLTSQITLDGKAVKSLSVAFENIYESATAPAGPQTGDNNDLMMWVTLLIVSGSVLAVLISKYRKNS